MIQSNITAKYLASLIFFKIAHLISEPSTNISTHYAPCDLDNGYESHDFLFSEDALSCMVESHYAISTVAIKFSFFISYIFPLVLRNVNLCLPSILQLRISSASLSSNAHFLFLFAPAQL